jgi:hypothetical protein
VQAVHQLAGYSPVAGLCDVVEGMGGERVCVSQTCGKQQEESVTVPLRS